MKRFVFLLFMVLGVISSSTNGGAQDVSDVVNSDNVQSENIEALASQEELITETVALSFAESSDVLNILQPLVTESSNVSAEEGSKFVILTGTHEQIDMMKKRIKDVDVQRFTMVFELGFAKASELSEKVEGMLTKSVGRVKFDDETNKLIITDTSSKIEEVRKIVEQLDRRDRQVHFDTKIVEISLNDEHRTGVDWEAIVSDYHSLKLSDMKVVESSSQKFGELSIGTIANEDYSILIEALDTVGSVNMISNPGITAENNKESRILVGSTQPLVPNEANQSKSGDSVDSGDFGAKIFVTPTIQTNGSIGLKIRPEVNLVELKTDPLEGDSKPAKDFDASETTLQIKEGVTIVIGGLIKEEKSKQTKKVPILGDVPVLGMAFRSYSHSIKKTEVVIFLKPRLTTGDVQ